MTLEHNQGDYYLGAMGLVQEELRRDLTRIMALLIVWLLATCIQHEMDHLEGIVFLDHLSRLKREMIMKKLTKARKAALLLRPPASMPAALSVRRMPAALMADCSSAL